MGKILKFRGTRAALQQAGHGVDRVYRVGDIADLLAFHDCAPRTLLDRLRTMAKTDGLPLPLNPRIYAKTVFRDERAICAASLWDADAIDAWLSRPGPFGGAPAMPAVPPSIRHEMAARAQRMGAGS